MPHILTFIGTTRWYQGELDLAEAAVRGGAEGAASRQGARAGKSGAAVPALHDRQQHRPRARRSWPHRRGAGAVRAMLALAQDLVRIDPRNREWVCAVGTGAQQPREDGLAARRPRDRGVRVPGRCRHPGRPGASRSAGQRPGGKGRAVARCARTHAGADRRCRHRHCASAPGAGRGRKAAGRRCGQYVFPGGRGAVFRAAGAPLACHR